MKTLSHGTVVGVTANESLDLCVLGKGRIETKRLRSDEDLIELLMRELPVLVSLSVARAGEGRAGTSVSSDLPTRTSTLARAIRYRGLPVVGSDLGAADKILGKRREAMLNELGALSVTSSGHLPGNDAKTAALVGWLFWSGSFDVLKATEDFSIVAPSNDTTDRWSDRVAIGLSGSMGSGKTTAGKHLQNKGFHYTRYSLVIEKIAQESGREPSRTTLQDLGREIHEVRGQYWLGRELLKNLPNSGCVVIDGLRYPEDHAFLAGSFGPCFGHITIVTPPETRRLQFIRSMPSEDYERAESHRSESGVKRVAHLAHMTVTNDGSLDRFLARIDAAVGELLHQTGRGWKCHDR